MQPVEGVIFPVVEIGILVLLIAAPAFIHFTEADGGPGAKHAAIAISLIAGLVVGALAQRTRLCMVGGIRDVVLFGEWKLLLGFVAILVSALIGNMILGYFHPGFADRQSRTQMVCGMHLEWHWLDLAACFLAAAHFVSWYWQEKEIQIPQLLYLD